MVELLKRWKAAVAAIVAALAALFWLVIADRHRKQSEKQRRRANELKGRRDVSIERASSHRRKAADRIVAAVNAQVNAESAIERVKENGHASLADRVDAYNRRVRGDERP